MAILLQYDSPEGGLLFDKEYYVVVYVKSYVGKCGPYA